MDRWLCKLPLLWCKISSRCTCRAANSHALCVRLTHFTPFHVNLTLSRIYGNMSEPLWCTKGTPTMCLLCENGCQNFWGKKDMTESPPRSSAFFGTCATFIGCERTGLAYLTPNPHPKLAALHMSSSSKTGHVCVLATCRCNAVYTWRPTYFVD